MENQRVGVSGVQPATILSTLTAVAIAGVVLFLIRWTSPILGPILLGFFFAALGRPVFIWLESKGLGRGWALLGVMAVLLLAGGALLLLAWLSVQQIASGLADDRELLLARFGFAGELLGGTAEAQVATGAALGNGASSTLVAIVAALAGAIGRVGIGFVLAIMLLLEWPRFGRIIRSVGGANPFLAKLPAVANTAVSYFAVRAKVNFLSTVAITLGFWALGVDNPLFWGIVNFPLSFVPYIGIFVATAGPALLVLAEQGWLAVGVLVVAVTVLNLGVEYLIAPMLTGRSLNLSPTIVFVMFFFWSWLLGPVGMLVSMPITVLLMLVLASDPGTAYLAQLLGGNADVSPAQVASTAPATNDATDVA